MGTITTTGFAHSGTLIFGGQTSEPPFTWESQRADRRALQSPPIRLVEISLLSTIHRPLFSFAAAPKPNTVAAIKKESQDGTFWSAMGPLDHCWRFQLVWGSWDPFEGYAFGRRLTLPSKQPGLQTQLMDYNKTIDVPIHCISQMGSPAPCCIFSQLSNKAECFDPFPQFYCPTCVL